MGAATLHFNNVRYSPDCGAQFVKNVRTLVEKSNPIVIEKQ